MSDEKEYPDVGGEWLEEEDIPEYTCTCLEPIKIILCPSNTNFEVK